MKSSGGKNKRFYQVHLQGQQEVSRQRSNEFGWIAVDG